LEEETVAFGYLRERLLNSGSIDDLWLSATCAVFNGGQRSRGFNSLEPSSFRIRSVYHRVDLVVLTFCSGSGHSSRNPLVFGRAPIAGESSKRRSLRLRECRLNRGPVSGNQRRRRSIRFIERFRISGVLFKTGSAPMDFRQICELAKRFDEKLQLATETCDLAKRDRLLREARELDQRIKSPEPIAD
jgi:hypothetical protein